MSALILHQYAISNFSEKWAGIGSAVACNCARKAGHESNLSAICDSV